jgi:hypothetical protein
VPVTDVTPLSQACKKYFSYAEGRVHQPAGRYDRPMSESDGTLQEQLEEIRVQLGWVRDYL